MAISPLRSEEIAFEHPYVLVRPNMLRRTKARKCNDRVVSCKTRNWLLLAAVAALAACAPQAVQPAPEPVIAGGWQKTDTSAEDVQAAARYAAGLVPKGHGAIAEVTSAETQVVAGTNIRMVLRFADGSHWKATVWHKLDGSLLLTEAEPLP
jgi:hypothetical protein